MNMYVDADAFCAVPGCGEAEVGHLGADSWERCEAFDCVRDVAVPFIAKDGCCLFEISASQV